MKPVEFEAQLKETEQRLERIKALYEQYFMGLERIAPERQHEQFKKALATLRQNQPRNTALRFRTQTLVQRHVTMSTHWKRILRQIEEGTYKRDVIRAKKRRAAIEAQKRQEEEKPGPRAYELDMDMDVDVDKLFGEAGDDLDAALDGLRMPSAPPAEPRAPSSAPQSFSRPKGVSTPKVERPPAAAARPQRSMPPPVPGGASRAAPTSKPGPGDDRMKQLYSSYIDARKKNNERTDNVKFESLQKSVDKMLPKLQQKYKGKKIDFEVVVKNGRVGLKPVAKD